MNRKVLLWLIPAALLTAASATLYRGFGSSPANSAVKLDTAQPPQLMTAHTGGSEREHEIKALEGELQKNPDHVPILMRLAQISRDSGKLDESVRYLREAVTQDPKNVDASLEFGRALFETGHVDEAIRATQHVLELNPTHVDALYNLGAIYGNLSQDDHARQYWEKAASIAPESESGRHAKENLAKLR